MTATDEGEYPVVVCGTGMMAVTDGRAEPSNARRCALKKAPRIPRCFGTGGAGFAFHSACSSASCDEPGSPCRLGVALGLGAQRTAQDIRVGFLGIAEHRYRLGGSHHSVFEPAAASGLDRRGSHVAALSSP